MEHHQGVQYQIDPSTTSSSSLRPSPNPPVLSFRAFHATHFTWSQRQAFFGSGVPTTPWAHSYPPFPFYPHPVKADTFAHPPESARETYRDNAQPSTVTDDKTTNHHNNTPTATTTEGGLTGARSGAAAFGLTQEAIEIFEFSRRFREEKAAAHAVERTRMARRRTKRRRLTRRGFAPDEGSSGSDEPLDAKHDDNNMRDDSDDEGSGGSENEDGGDDGEDGDEFVAQCEPLATDTVFLTQPSRQRDRTRQRLYGLKKLSDRKDKDASLVLTKSSTSISTSDDMWSINMLEAMLNQTFVDSLSFESTASTKEVVPGNLGRRSRESGRRSGAAKSSSSQQSQVVYWPGMPMRC